MGHNQQETVLQKQKRYAKIYSSIIVTYKDDVKKTFTPNDWALFSTGVRKIAKDIEYIKL